MHILVWFLLFYVGYRFVFHFLIPLVMTARLFRKSLRAKKEQWGNNGTPPFEQQASSRQPHRNGPSGEYIDFQEL